MPPDNLGHVWDLDRFDERLPNLGTLPAPEWKALFAWLNRIRHNPAAVPRQTLVLGRHVGQTADAEDREPPFPPAYRSMIGSRILCEFMVDVDAHKVTCIDLRLVDPR